MGDFPSKANQFGPGNNANPKGRPRGKSITTYLREIGEAVAFKGKGRLGGAYFREMLDSLGLALPEDGADQGESPGLTFNQMVAIRLFAEGLHGWETRHALKALQMIQDRQEGRAPLPIKNDDGPLEIRVVYADGPADDPPAPPGAGDDPAGDAQV
jgi:hypothetical protein